MQHGESHFSQCRKRDVTFLQRRQPAGEGDARQRPAGRESGDGCPRAPGERYGVTGLCRQQAALTSGTVSGAHQLDGVVDAVVGELDDGVDFEIELQELLGVGGRQAERRGGGWVVQRWAETPDLAESGTRGRVEGVDTRLAKIARIDPKGRRLLPLPRWMRRQGAALLRTEDREVEISIRRMPASVDVESVKGIALYVVSSSAGSECPAPVEQIDESTRQVFAQVGEEYDELCERLFAGDPVFSYRTTEDTEPQ